MKVFSGASGFPEVGWNFSELSGRSHAHVEQMEVQSVSLISSSALPAAHNDNKTTTFQYIAVNIYTFVKLAFYFSVTT